MTDTEMLNWLQKQTRSSYTGISFDFYKDEENHPQYRYMQKHFIGEPSYTLRGAVVLAKAALDGKDPC